MEAFAYGVLLLLYGLALLDTTASLRLWPRAFGLGFRLAQMPASLPAPSVPVDTIFRTRQGVFKLCSFDTMLFRPRYRVFALMQPNSANCSVKWEAGEAVVTARLPLSGSIALVLFPAILVAVLLLNFFIEAEDLRAQVIFMFGALSFGAVGVWLMARRTRRWVRVVLTEYEEHIGSGRA